jgi:hypothetical protein
VVVDPGAELMHIVIGDPLPALKRYRIVRRARRRRTKLFGHHRQRL